MITLTKKQKNVFVYIKQYIEKNEYAPSLEEIQEYFKLASVSTVSHYVNELQRKGYLKREANQSRSISIQPDEVIKTILPIDVKYLSVPILGSANAGDAILNAEENIEGFLRVSRDVLNRKDGVFTLRVDGDSMNQAKIDGKKIEEGDFVIIDSEQKDPKNNDYILSIIDGCANIKKFIKDKLGVRLESESNNPIHKPIYISSEDDYMVNGKIIAVIKK